MAYLVTIGGVGIPCNSQGVQQEESEFIGSDESADAGNLRSTIQLERRVWSVTTPAVTSTVRGNILTAAAPRPVAVTGVLVGGSSLNCFVTVKYGQVKKKALGDTRYVLTILIKQAVATAVG